MTAPAVVRSGSQQVLTQGYPSFTSTVAGSQVGQIISEPRVEVMTTSQGGPCCPGCQRLQAQMAGVMAQLAACKARLDKLDPPESPLQRETRIIEQRGNVCVNHESGHVRLLRPIAFQPRTTKDEPTAVFKDVDLADAICRDISEISNIFCCPLTIEGHTKGGESDFWQTLANRRACLVADKMVEFGANPNLLETRGLPGRMGRNEVRIEIFMDVRNIKDEKAAVQEIDIVVGGRVVERDFIQAGRLVERDVSQPGALGVSVLNPNLVSTGSSVIVNEASYIGFGSQGLEARPAVLGSQVLSPQGSQLGSVFASQGAVFRPASPQTYLRQPLVM